MPTHEPAEAERSAGEDLLLEMPEPTPVPALDPGDYGPWSFCEDALLARLTRFEPPGEGALGERVEGGWVAEAVDFLDDGDRTGVWGCRTAGDEVEVAWLSAAYAMRVGPIFRAAADGTNVRAANWLGRVLLAENRAAAARDRTPRTVALRRAAECTAPNGRPLTSGVFISLQRLGRFGTPDAIYGWYVLPDRLEGDVAVDRVALQRRGSLGPVSIEFDVSEGGCIPLDEGAEQAWRAANGIRSERVVLDLESFEGGVRRGRSPSSASTTTQRAVLWVLSRSAEIDTIEDWLTYHATQRTYASTGWLVIGPDEEGRYRVSHTFTLGNDRYSLDWLVNPVNGTVEPASALAGLARAVQPSTPRPRDLGPREQVLEGSGEGSGAMERGPLTGAEIDALLLERQNEVLDCYRFEVARRRPQNGVSATFEVNADGRAVNIDVTIDGTPSRGFERCFERFISGTRFPRFEGDPVPARSSFTFNRVD